MHPRATAGGSRASTRRCQLVSAAVLATVIAAPSAPATGTEQDTSSPLHAAVASTVGVRAATGSGTGFLTPQGVATAAHVVEGGDDVTLLWDDGTSTQGEVARRDRVLDLAVIDTDVPTGHEPLAFDASPEVGTSVTVIAVDLSEGPVLTRGIISALPTQGSLDMIQVDAAVNPGTSGGPILGDDGRVLGLVIAKDPLRDDVGLGHRADDVADFLAGESVGAEAPSPPSRGVAVQAPTAPPPIVPVGIAASLVLLLAAGAVRGRRPPARHDDLTIILGPERAVPDHEKDLT